MEDKESSFPRLRNHKQYTDIENFKDYEFRSCIAYELAIRHEDIIELIENGFRAYIDQDLNNPNPQSIIGEMKYSGSFFKKLRDDYLFPQGLYLKYHFFDTLREEIEDLIKQKEEYDTKIDLIFDDMEKTNRRKLTKAESAFLRSRKDIKMLPQLIFSNEVYNFNDMFYVNSTVFNIIERVTPLFKETLYHLENEKEEKISRNSIIPNYARPALYSFRETISRKVELNLALPTNELKNFIEELSKDFMKNRASFKSINELLELPLNPTTESFSYKGKRLADMLYIYDYTEFKINADPNSTANSIIEREQSFLLKTLNKNIDAIAKDYRLIKKIIDKCEYKKII